jgi:hypothetical protein
MGRRVLRNIGWSNINTCGVQEFPFALVSINITRWAVDMLELGKLNSIARKNNNVMKACDLFHRGACYLFYRSWSKQGGNILELGVRLSGLERSAKRSAAWTVASATEALQAF